MITASHRLLSCPHILFFLLGVLATGLVQAQNSTPMQRIGSFEIDRTEVTIGQFQRYVEATRAVTSAERSGGGSTFEAGWEQRKGWTWRAPYGKPGAADEPAVHVTYDEAAAFCKWAGKRLPTDAEWGEAAHIERRPQPSGGFITGRSYRYPTGDSPEGANCLGDCGNVKAVAHAATSRGKGHAEAGTTKQGVNGLYDMGGNVWEWVNSGTGAEQRTRGGSWWYGATQMLDSHVQGKPRDTAVVYIGFRCVRDVAR
jgi:formylglycine-generating enzyme required for sulfatase activity